MYHVAKKAVPYYDEEKKGIVKPADKNGIKFELFIFDAFQECRDNGFGLMEVNREAEFAPVKNKCAPGATDSPDTAREFISKLHQSWLIKAGWDFGGVVANNSDKMCEISSLISINGEGLASYKPNGVTTLPYHLTK